MRAAATCSPSRRDTSCPTASRPQSLEVLADRGECRTQVAGLGDIVETYDGDIGGHPHAALEQPGDQPERHVIIGAENRRRGAVHGVRRVVSRAGRPVPLQHVRRRQTEALHLLRERGAPLLRVDVLRRSGDEPDGGMAERREVREHLAHAGALIDVRGGVPSRGDRDDGDPVVAQRFAPGQRGQHEDPLDGAVDERGVGTGEIGCRRAASDGERCEPRGPDRVLDGVERRRRAVVGKGGGDDADQAGPAASQRPRREVRPVSQPGHLLAHPRGRPRQYARRAVDHPRDGLDRDAGRRRDLPHRRRTRRPRHRALTRPLLHTRRGATAPPGFGRAVPWACGRTRRCRSAPGTRRSAGCSSSRTSGDRRGGRASGPQSG